MVVPSGLAELVDAIGSSSPVGTPSSLVVDGWSHEASHEGCGSSPVTDSVTLLRIERVSVCVTDGFH